MYCRKCHALLTESSFCPKCGSDVSLQKRVSLVSAYYYNQGLEKAQIRDLSGAADLLVRSLKYNKRNIQARNLLGLVYFEMGEAVAAMSEWVISVNMQTADNPAQEYIDRMKSGANKLDVINKSIKKYNDALEACRSGHSDTAVIQLKKVLNQNPKLIKGYNLLALIYINNGEYKKAQKVLKRAVRIDQTNPTTLRFLNEINEQIGPGPVEAMGGRFGSRNRQVADVNSEIFVSDNEVVVQPPAFRESSIIATLINLCFGLVVGAAVVWYLVVPAKMTTVNQTANDKIVEYSNTMASQSAEVAKMREQMAASEETVASAQEQITAARTEVDSYTNLLKAYSAYEEKNYAGVLSLFENIDETTLSVDARILYDSISKNVGDYMFNSYKNEGLSAYLAEDYTLASEKLQKAADLDESDYNVLVCLAVSYRKLGSNAPARVYFQKIVDKFPGTRRATNAQTFIDLIDREDPAAQNAGAQPVTGRLAEEAAQEEAAAQAAGTEGEAQDGELGNPDEVLGNQ